MKSSKVKQAIKRQNKRNSDQHLLTNQQLSVNPISFPQQFYLAQEIEIAEEYEQALEANSLEKIKYLLDKVL